MATRSQMRDRARVRADQGDAFPTTTDYNTYVDQAAADVWRRLVGAGWKPDRTTVAITANGATSYNVGTDVHTIIEVNRLEGGQSFPMRRARDEDIAALRSLTGQASHYDLVGGALAALTIEFFPRPSTGSYEVRYIKRFPGFAADGDNWYGPDGSDELIVLGAAIRGLEQEDGDTSALMRDFQDRWSEVLEQATWLDARHPQTIRDVNKWARIRVDAGDLDVEGVDI